MITFATVIGAHEVASLGVVVVPVVVTNEGALVAASIPTTIGTIAIPRAFTSQWCQDHGLTSTPGSSVVLREAQGPSVVLVSCGETYQHLEAMRRLAGAGVRHAHGVAMGCMLPTEAIEDCASVAQALVEGAMLASYDYKSTLPDSQLAILPTGLPLPTITAHEDVVSGVRRGTIIADAANWAKRLVDTPPNVMTPKELAKHITARLEGEAFVHVSTWNESTIREERLGAVQCVSSGSAEPARVTIATYAHPKAIAHLALVGKGVTFDSGGLAIKPLASMLEMKTDMSGAAVVAAVLSAVAALELPIQITMITPLVENMSGEKAVKPSDVIVARSGTSIEVANPDAEGRLILADALTLAVESEPDAIIDVATLTGAMVTALGEECAGYFSSSDELANRLETASARSGEGFWRMPFVDAYEDAITSDVADLKNMGKVGGGGGAITAALFLRHFTNDLPWLHLDIAGPAMASKAHGYVTRGATAWGLRTLIAFVDAVAHDGR